MTHIIEMKSVRKTFGGRLVLDGFELAVQPGEALGLLGPSGAGKSTILRMVAGLETPDAGEVRVSSSRIGYVFQEARLLPWSTAQDNVALPLLARGAKKRDAAERARFFLARMDLAGFERAMPHQLSGGMRQRVSLARALAVEPEILLLDEPFTGLDFALKENMRILLDAALHSTGCAVVHVTHDPAELPARTNRIVRLERLRTRA